jgi:hypothetical protein
LARPEGETDFYFVPAADPDQAVRRIVELVQSRIPARFGLNPIRDCGSVPWTDSFQPPTMTPYIISQPLGSPRKFGMSRGHG